MGTGGADLERMNFDDASRPFAETSTSVFIQKDTLPAPKELAFCQEEVDVNISEAE